MILMIGKETIENVKEVLYMTAKSKKWCTLCCEGIPHKDHDWVCGTMNLGSIEYVRSVIDSVLVDTTQSKFRLVETLHFLESNGYIRQVNISDTASMMGVFNIWITEKLIQEMKSFEIKEKVEWY